MCLIILLGWPLKGCGHTHTSQALSYFRTILVSLKNDKTKNFENAFPESNMETVSCKLEIIKSREPNTEL